jgi:predicted nucleic acid-binding protein
MVGPSLIVAEVGNLAWKRVRRGLATTDDAHEMVSVAIGLLAHIVPNEELWERALGLSFELDHSIYDCFYLALAQRENVPLATADLRLAALARGMELEARYLGEQP